jgi:hypothetical protein
VVADVDFSVGQHIGAQDPSWMSACSVPGFPSRGHALEVRARHAEPLAQTLDVSDAEGLADKRVEIDAPG